MWLHTMERLFIIQNFTADKGQQYSPHAHRHVACTYYPCQAINTPLEPYNVTPPLTPSTHTHISKQVALLQSRHRKAGCCFRRDKMCKSPSYFLLTMHICLLLQQLHRQVFPSCLAMLTLCTIYRTHQS